MTIKHYKLVTRVIVGCLHKWSSLKLAVGGGGFFFFFFFGSFKFVIVVICSKILHQNLKASKLWNFLMHLISGQLNYQKKGEKNSYKAHLLYT